MVRTLSFHLNNTGSNPVNLIVFRKNYLIANYNNLNVPFRLKFRFITYFKPSIVTTKTRLTLKYSYLFCVLISQIFLNFTPINGALRVKMVVFKQRTNVLTLTKAPMAHKKFSKEQFNLVFYKVVLNMVTGYHLTSLKLSKLFFIFIFFFKYNLLPETSNFFLKTKTAELGASVF